MDEMARRQFLRRGGNGWFAQQENNNEVLSQMSADFGQGSQAVCKTGVVRFSQEKETQTASNQNRQLAEQKGGVR